MHPIRKISVYHVVLDMFEGTYTMSGNRAMSQFDSTIVRIETETGYVGWGEFVPLGANYLPAYGEGARTGLRELGPNILNHDATCLEQLNNHMDSVMRGHPYVKTAIDMACWDILGKVAGLPVCTLLGGRYGEKIDLYRSITHETPKKMVEIIRGFQDQGFKRFQLKVGGRADEDIERISACYATKKPDEIMVADSNGGWVLADAMRVVRAIESFDIYLEQPCISYDECLAIRGRTSLPFILDESIDSLSALLRGLNDGAMDAINIKLSKLGGLTRSRVIRDACIAKNIRMELEDTACTDIGAAAVAHFAHSTPENLRLAATLANVKVKIPTATGAPQANNGIATAPTVPGLGVEPVMDVLGDPIFVIE